MRTVIEVCVIGCVLMGLASAQEAAKPALRKGVSVQMPVASHAVEMRAADEENATVVAITAAGKVYVGITPTDPNALKNLTAGTVYVKADSRVPFQDVLTVLDALRGKSVVLLVAPDAKVERGKMAPPYGMKVTISE
jgi:biopolymer transport protein ExbD